MKRAVLFALVISAILATAAEATVNVGSAAPAFSATTLDGKTVKLSDYAGKYVLLDFFATW